MKARIFLLPLLIAAALAYSERTVNAAPELKAWLGSAYNVPGEESELWLTIISDTRPAMLPVVPETGNITFKFLGDSILPNSTRERMYAYRYTVESHAEGSHLIPPFTIEHQGLTLRSQALRFHVTSLPEHAWFEQDIHGQKSLFASQIRIPRRARFEGETTPAEVKIYLPANFKVDKATIAEVAHDGVAAERFDISRVIPGSSILVTRARLKQQKYIGIAYRSTITPLHEGPVSIGPGLARLTLQARILRRGFTDTVPVPLDLPVPEHSFTVRPLPDPVPAGYKNAVGRFIVSVRANTSELREDDPVSVQLTVTGTGNLDTLSAPELTAKATEWKSYPPHRLPRQGARRDASGVAKFTQTIRPNGIQKVIPPYQLIFFDPHSEQYVTTTTPPIPFTLIPSTPELGFAGPMLPDLETPVEEMEGILGLINPRPDPPTTGLQHHLTWHLLPALLSLALLVQIARIHFLPRLRPTPRELHLKRDLATIEQAGPNSRDFLRATGAFIENWIPEDCRDEEIRRLLTRRDNHCYKPSSRTTEIREQERRTVITQLKRRVLEVATAITFFAFLDPGTALGAEDEPSARELYQQAEAAWKKNAYRLALHLYHEAHRDNPIPADVLYNMGNCYFRLGERGLATLYYRRALHRNPEHPEALQNLQFLKRKTGAFVMEHPTYQKWIGKIPRTFYKNVIAAGLWLILLVILSFFSMKRRRRLLLTAMTVAPLFCMAGGVCLLLYPTDLSFAPTEQQATMINRDSIHAVAEAANMDAPDEGSKVIEVPPGSLCRPLANRGPWTYIELSNGIRGWVPSNFVRHTLPIDGNLPAVSAESG